jgi:type II secretory pathway component PulK
MFLRLPNTGPRPRKGVVLLAVLMVVVVLTLAAYQFSEFTLSEYKAAENTRRAAQARALAGSGVNYTAALLSNPDSLASILNGNPYDNPQAFQDVLVAESDNPRLRGRFSVLALLDPDDPAAGSQPYRFGVLDETGRLNLNALFKLDSSGQVLHDRLMTLPNMTEDIANSIIDWIDPDEEPRSGGAENEYYQTLPTPYMAKNGPLDSLEELLLVKGVTPQLLFGNDRNRNGVLDPDEDDGSGTLDRGWAAFLTVHSREQNVDSQGNPRIFINDSDLQGLSTKLNTALGQDLANYILAYRQYGPASSQQGGSGQGGGRGGSSPSSGPSAPSSGPTSGTAASPAGGVGGAGGGGRPGSGGGGGRQGGGRLTSGSLNLQGGGQRRIGSLYELVNSSVTIPGENGQQGTTYPSPLNNPSNLKQLLPLLLDMTTTESNAEVPARVNVNTAPRAVLAALPGLSDADVQTILDRRPSLSSADAPDPIFQTPAWLMTEANFSADTLRTLEKYVTARSQVYRVQVVGHFDGGGPTVRVEAVIDTNAGRPRVIYWRDLTELGRGFTLPAPQ